MTKCDKCPRRAIIYQRYSGKHLCREHFEEDVQRKIREALRKTGLFGHGSRIAVGLDGGRKSAALAFALKNIFIRRSDLDLLAVIIDEEKEANHIVKQACHVAEQLSLPYIVKCLPLPRDGQPPVMQSAWKRELLFCMAVENDANILATGESLDDEALEIFVNYLQGDVDAVLSEDSGREEQRIAWIKPLRRIPEKEVRLYAIGHDLGFDNAGEMLNTDAMRCAAKTLLRCFDSRHPGTNYSLLRSLEKAQDWKSGQQGQSL